MSRVQISNARRISFTALAVVSFWVLAIRGYWVTSDLGHGSSGYHGEPGRWVEILDGIGWGVLALIGLSLALIPTAFLHTSTTNRLLERPERSVWFGGLGLVCANGF